MRPTLIAGITAVLAFAGTIAATAGADPKAPPPSIAIAGGNVTITAASTKDVKTHLNPDYSWSIKDASGTALKKKTDFNFSGGTSKEPQVASVGAAAGTLKGAYCTDSNCIPFTATCTATSCTVN